MKKNKELMLKLLKEDNLSLKEISKRTGYHEKSLIRIKKMIKNDLYKYRSLTLKEKDYIIKLYLNSKTKTVLEFYNYYLLNNSIYPKRSYSTIQKLIKKHKNKSNYILIGNVADKDSFERVFFAFDLDEKKTLYLEKGFEKSHKIYFKIVKYIQNNFKNKTIVFKGNSFLKNKKGIKYKNFINYLNKNNISYSSNKIYLSKKSIDKIINTKHIESNTNQNLIKELFLEKIVISEEKRIVFKNNIIEYKNIGYKIDTDNIIPKGKVVEIIFYLFDKNPYVKIDNKIYNITKTYNKESKKKYS